MSPDADLVKVARDASRVHREAAAYLAAVDQVCRNQRILMGESGCSGLGSEATETGDVIVVFDGAETPFMLRRLRQIQRTG